MRLERVCLPTHGFAEWDLLFEIETNTGQSCAELPEALGWLETYRRSEVHAGVLMLICWAR